MTEAPREGTRNIVKDLASAASTQSKFSNWLWLALVFVSLVVLIPRQAGAKLVELPFGLGSVEPQVFYSVAMFMLSVLLVAFCQAHAQAVRARILAHRVLDRMGNEPIEGVHPRDLFDALGTPSLSRVAPLAQMVRGKWQFYPESRECPAYLRILTTVLYAFLKILATIAYLVLPGGALLLALWRFLGTPLASTLPPLFRLLGSLYAAGGILSLSLVFVYDVRWSVMVIKKIGAAQVQEH